MMIQRKGLRTHIKSELKKTSSLAKVGPANNKLVVGDVLGDVSAWTFEENLLHICDTYFNPICGPS